jgi:hypothetical protein
MLKFIMQNIFIRTTVLIINNLCIWRLTTHFCYKTQTISDIMRYSFISISCWIGLWFATTDFGLKYKKITSILILPSFVITPFFVTAEYYFLTTLVVSSGILAFIRIFRGSTHEMVATFAKK